MVDPVGFEPTNERIKASCLTTWRRINNREYLCMAQIIRLLTFKSLQLLHSQAATTLLHLLQRYYPKRSGVRRRTSKFLVLGKRFELSQ